MKKTTKTLIISISAVVLLIGAFLLVYFLVPTTSGDEDDLTSQLMVEEYNLVSHIPAEIQKMEIKNEYGEFTLLSETPTKEVENEDGTTSTYTEATVYTLENYEDMEMLTGAPDTIANDCASVTSTKIVDDGSKKSDFGFDNPRAVVKVTYTTGDTATITLGNDAAAELGAYVMVEGDENVYLVASDAVDGYLYGAMDLITTEIGFAAADDTGNKFTKMVFGGSLFDGKEVVLDYSDYTAFSETYVITSPDNTLANEETVTYMVNNVRNLTAKKVITLNADEEDLKEYGLDNPYVTVDAEYPDLTVSYKATQPDKENLCYLVSNDIIYQMDALSLPWVSYSYDQILPKNVMSPKYSGVDKITVETADKKYEFVISRETVVTQEEDTDVETTVTKVTCNGNELDENNFSIFYQNLTSAERAGAGEIPSDEKAVLTVKYEFSDGKTGSAVYYEAENRKCPVLVNDTLSGTAFESYVTKITEDVVKVSAGEAVTSIF